MGINRLTKLACPWWERHGQVHIYPHSRGYQEADMPQVIDWDELERNGPTSYVFTGERHGASVCVLIADLPPGGGPRLHRHPYEEVFVLHEGRARFTVGDGTLEAGAGQILVVPAGIPHKFVNTGDAQLRVMSVHASPRRLGEWLED